MQKILIVGDTEAACYDMREKIEGQLPYELHHCLNLNGVKDQLATKVFSLVLMNQILFNEKSLTLIDYLKNSGHALPVLVLADKILQEYQKRLNLLLDIHILMRPVLDKNITGLVRKLLQVRSVPKQIYRRFNTNQMAQMEGLASGDNLLTSMYNLSKGGVYCEFESPSRVTIGDLFRMKVCLDETSSEYTFNAKVVWTTPKGRFSGRTGCGMKFVSAKDTYRALLSKT
jgi:Tfp pilus assembly protein PilZ